MEGDKPVQEMSDREINEETLTILRGFTNALVEMSGNPMLRMMMPGVKFPAIGG